MHINSNTNSIAKLGLFRCPHKFSHGGTDPASAVTNQATHQVERWHGGASNRASGCMSNQGGDVANREVAWPRDGSGNYTVDQSNDAANDNRGKYGISPLSLSSRAREASQSLLWFPCVNRAPVKLGSRVFGPVAPTSVFCPEARLQSWAKRHFF